MQYADRLLPRIVPRAEPFEYVYGLVRIGRYGTEGTIRTLADLPVLVENGEIAVRQVVAIQIVPGACGTEHQSIRRIHGRRQLRRMGIDIARDRRLDGGPAITEEVMHDSKSRSHIGPVRRIIDAG